MKLVVEFTEEDIRKLLADHIEIRFGVRIEPAELPITVRSSQNYRVKEWEKGEFRCSVEVNR